MAGEVGCPDTSGPRRLLLGPGCSEHGRPSGRRMAGALADGRSTDSCGLCQAAPLVGGGCRAPAGLLTPASCRPAGCFRSQVRTRAVCLRSSPSRRQDWSDKRNGKGGGEGGDRSGVGGPSWVSRSAGLNFSLLRAGRAAAFSLLVIHRAGMANQASAEPGAEEGRVGGSWVFAPSSQQSSPGSVQGGLPFPKRCLNAPPPPESFKSKRQGLLLAPSHG